MDVASLSHLPVGVLGWNSPDPVFTVVTKATFTLAGGRLALAAEQEPMGLDRPDPRSTTELYAASDFAPKKRGIDVLLTGHARAQSPVRVVPFALTVGKLRLVLHAVSDAPATAVPLLERYVRRRPADPASAVRVMPRRTAVRGWLSRTVAPSFDYAAFNAAPPEHWLDELAPDAPLVLEGLLATATRRELRLGGVTAFAWQLEDRASRDATPIAMRCDTLWMDVDREMFTLTWRGVMPRRGAQRPAVAVLLDAAEPPWADVRARLGRVAWQAAVQPHELESAPPARFDDGVAPSEREPTLSALMDVPPPPTVRRGEDDEPTLGGQQRWRKLGGTVPMDEAEKQGAALREILQRTGALGTLELSPEDAETIRMREIRQTIPESGRSTDVPESMKTTQQMRRQRRTDPMPHRPPESSPTLGLDRYVDVRIALEASNDSVAVLAAENVTLEQFEKAHRFWNERALADRAVQNELQTRLGRARSR
jgi:uncharacterized protein DUF2169